MTLELLRIENFSFSLDGINQGQLRGGCVWVLSISLEDDRREY